MFALTVGSYEVSEAFGHAAVYMPFLMLIEIVYLVFFITSIVLAASCSKRLYKRYNQLEFDDKQAKLMFAALAVGFVARPISAAVEKGIVAKPVGLNVWLVVFVVVALQTITLVRPMLAPLGTPREPNGKCFFIMHFADSVGLIAPNAR